jgi:hypothetical protein
LITTLDRLSEDLTAAAKPRAGDVRQVPLPGGDPTLVAATS